MDRPALTVQIVAMLVFAFAALVRVPTPPLPTLTITMGLTQFLFGALVRTRRSYALHGVEGDEQLLNTTHAMEAVIDEIVFISRLTLAARLVTSVHPVSQLLVPTVACGIGSTMFFLLKFIQPPVIMEQISVAAHDNGSPAASEDADQLALHQFKRSGAKPRSILLYAGILPLPAVFIMFDMSFTPLDASIIATVRSMGLEPFLGLQLAVFAVGSYIGALVFGSYQLKGSRQAHMVMLLSLPIVGYVFSRLLMDSLILLGVLEILAGLAVSPTFATDNLIVKGPVPAKPLAKGLSWVTATDAAGTSTGSSVADIVLDASNPHAGMALPFVSTLAPMPLVLVGWALAKRRG